MTKPPQLAPLDAEEQRLYSEFPPDGRDPHTISKAELRHPPKETHFSRLYPRSCSFAHYPNLVTMGEGSRWTSKWTRIWISKLKAPPSGSAPSLPQRTRGSALITADKAPIRVSISRSNLPSLENKIPKYLNSSAWGRDSSPTWREHSTFFSVNLNGIFPFTVSSYR